MPLAFLLAMQASGMVIDYLGRQDQIRMGRMGAKLEQESINADIASSRLQYEENSLEAMKQLRQNMGTQAAMFAARGVNAGAGTAVLFGNESVGNFNSNERIRKLNLRTREAQLKAGVTMSKMHQRTNENKIWNEFRQNTINRIPTSPDSWKGFNQAFSNEGFGLTKVGG